MTLVPYLTLSHPYALHGSPSSSRRLERVTAESCTAPSETLSLSLSTQSVSRSRLPLIRTVSPSIRPISAAFFGWIVHTLLSASFASSAVSRLGSTTTLASGLSSSPSFTLRAGFAAPLMVGEACGCTPLIGAAMPAEPPRSRLARVCRDSPSTTAGPCSASSLSSSAADGSAPEREASLKDCESTADRDRAAAPDATKSKQAVICSWEQICAGPRSSSGVENLT